MTLSHPDPVVCSARAELRRMVRDDTFMRLYGDDSLEGHYAARERWWSVAKVAFPDSRIRWSPDVAMVNL